MDYSTAARHAVVASRADGRSRVSQFHISDIKSLRIAREALHHRQPITISGMVGKGIRFFTGVVQSIEEDKLTIPKRWRVTILDGQK
jgi:hypothetical protein